MQYKILYSLQFSPIVQNAGFTTLQLCDFGWVTESLYTSLPNLCNENDMVSTSLGNYSSWDN